MQPGWGVTLGPVGFAPPSAAAQPRRTWLSISSFYVLRQQRLKATVSVTLVSDQDGRGCLSPARLVPRADPAPQQDTASQQGADRTPSIGPTAGCCTLAVFCSLEPPSLPYFSSLPSSSLLPCPTSSSCQSLFRNLRALTSEVFISSISANVGALSRTRGLGRWALLPTSETDRLMQEVDLTSPEQALRMQGREPNPGGGRR